MTYSHPNLQDKCTFFLILQREMPYFTLTLILECICKEKMSLQFTVQGSHLRKEMPAMYAKMCCVTIFCSDVKTFAYV